MLGRVVDALGNPIDGKGALNKGVKKGALTVEQADKKFENWLSDKEKKIHDKIKNLLEDDFGVAVVTVNPDIIT